MSAPESHETLAQRLRERVLSAGVIPRAVREGALAAGAGESTDLADEFDIVARQVGAASYRVTDEQVASARARAGSDVGTFEVVMSASVGAGLRRWDAASRVIGQASDAAS